MNSNNRYNQLIADSITAITVTAALAQIYAIKYSAKFKSNAFTHFKINTGIILMAHLVETMAFVGQTPWHGLGNELTPNQPIEVWAQQAGMDWRIESSDVSYMAQNEKGQSIIMPFEEQRVLYRSDTHAPLSVVSFQEVQPMEILHFYKDLTEQSGFELETAGCSKVVRNSGHWHDRTKLSLKR
jgi:hypothetical protein